MNQTATTHDPKYQEAVYVFEAPVRIWPRATPIWKPER